MIERTRTMAFAAGALVFPGGRINPGDHRAAAAVGAGFDDAAARIAAIRETIEETGIAAAISPIPDASIVAAVREDLAAGVPFGRLLEQHRLRLDLAALTRSPAGARTSTRHAASMPPSTSLKRRRSVATAAPMRPRRPACSGPPPPAFWARSKPGAPTRSSRPGATWNASPASHRSKKREPMPRATRSARSRLGSRRETAATGSASPPTPAIRSRPNCSTRHAAGDGRYVSSRRTCQPARSARRIAGMTMIAAKR